MLRPVCFVLLPFFSVAGVATAHAQFAVYGMGSGGFLGSTNASQGSSVSQSNSFSSYGATVGVYDDFVRLGPLKLGADARYFQDNGGSNSSSSYGNKLHGGLAGLRLALKLPLVSLKPYVQGEVGGVGTNYGVNPDETGTFAYQVQGGLDFTIFPHVDLRGEYGAGQVGAVGAGKVSLQEAGVGLVVRFF